MPTRSLDPNPCPEADRREPESLGPQDPVWMLTARTEGRRPWPLILAIGVHAGLLLLQFPKVTEIEAEPERKQHILLVPPPRFEPPKPEPIELKPPKVRKQPIPDPSPDDPEPLIEDFEIEPALDLPSTDELFVVPDGPPPLPQDTGPIAIRGEVKAPVVVEKIYPQYTEIARRARRQGVVVLKAVIDREGRVVDAKILKPLGFGLDEAALEAAGQWRFTPATLHGKPVAVYMNLTVTFSMS